MNFRLIIQGVLGVIIFAAVIVVNGALLAAGIFFFTEKPTDGALTVAAIAFVTVLVAFALLFWNAYKMYVGDMDSSRRVREDSLSPSKRFSRWQ